MKFKTPKRGWHFSSSHALSTIVTFAPRCDLYMNENTERASRYFVSYAIEINLKCWSEGFIFLSPSPLINRKRFQFRFHTKSYFSIKIALNYQNIYLSDFRRRWCLDPLIITCLAGAQSRKLVSIFPVQPCLLHRHVWASTHSHTLEPSPGH